MCPFHDEFILFWTAALLLALATVVEIAQLRWPRLRLRGTFLALMYGGLVFQSLAIYLRGDLRGQFPVTNPFETLQAIVWATIAMTLLLRYSVRLTLLNLFGGGLAAALALVALAMPNWDDEVTRLTVGTSPWTAFHAWVAVIGYAMFAVLTATSLMYLIQHHSLKRGLLGGFFVRLPSIRLLETVNRRILLAGVLTLSVALGLGLLNLLAHPAAVGLPKLLTAVALWTAYLALYVLRNAGYLRASQFAAGCVVAFLVAIIALWPLTAGTRTPEPPVGSTAS